MIRCHNSSGYEINMLAVRKAGCFEDDILSSGGVPVFRVGLDKTASWQSGV